MNYDIIDNLNIFLPDWQNYMCVYLTEKNISYTVWNKKPNFYVPDTYRLFHDFGHLVFSAPNLLLSKDFGLSAQSVSYRKASEVYAHNFAYCLVKSLNIHQYNKWYSAKVYLQEENKYFYINATRKAFLRRLKCNKQQFPTAARQLIIKKLEMLKSI